jgi:hypothetical protein
MISSGVAIIVVVSAIGLAFMAKIFTLCCIERCVVDPLTKHVYVTIEDDDDDQTVSINSEVG